MKSLVLLFSLFVTVPSFSYETKNVVRDHLHNMRNLVRSCTVVPYTYRNGIKVYHHLLSHCPEVRVLEKGKASVKIGSRTFFIVISESAMSDGDLFNVDIREYISNDRLVIRNVHAYGDVLLGILDGNTAGVRKTYFPQSNYGMLRDL